MTIPRPEKARTKTRRYASEVATQRAEITSAQKLRYKVFANEMGAQLHSIQNGLHADAIDDYCDHLLVRDLQTGNIVACTRLLSDVQARRLGHFYSEGKFYLDRVLTLPGRFLEIGRTCVDPAHRGSVVLSTLWGGF